MSSQRKERMEQDHGTSMGRGVVLKTGGKAAQTRLRILQNAERMFTKYPYEIVTLRRIAELSGINVALIARYFGSKKDLFCAVLDSVSAQQSSLSRKDNVTALAGKAIKALEAGPEEAPPSSILTIFMLSAQSPEVMPVIQERVKSFFTDVAGEEGVEALPPVYLFTSCLVGVMTLRRLLPSDEPPFLSREELRRAWRLFSEQMDAMK